MTNVCLLVLLVVDRLSKLKYSQDDMDVIWLWKTSPLLNINLGPLSALILLQSKWNVE